VAAATAGVVYLQLVLGALMRHMNAGLSIPDFPLAFGRLVPPLESAEVLVHFAHRLGAVLVAVFVVLTAWSFLRERAAGPRLRALGGLLFGLLCLQVTLGAYTIWTKIAPLPTTFHVATGAALLGTSVLLALGSYGRLALPETAP
jgi:cytochrome c oxidase assembly protein subunit 15